MSQGKRESFNIKQGDIVRIRAGTTIYMINRDKNKKLRIAKLLQPVALPDEFQVNLWPYTHMASQQTHMYTDFLF